MRSICLLSLLAAANAFSPNTVGTQRRNTDLAAMPKEFKQLAGAFMVTSTVLSNVMLVPTSASASSFDEGTSQMIAARSGGRAGGRSAPRSAPRASAPPTRVIERRTTVVQPSPIMMGSPMYAAPPPSGLGLAIGLNAVSGISEGFREARQENEIRSTREQLTEARIKEAEMEARLRALENAK